MYRYSLGFTMLEVVVCLAVFGVLSLAVTPALRDVIAQPTLELLRMRMEETLHSASFEAVARSEDMRLTFNEDRYALALRASPHSVIAKGAFGRATVASFSGTESSLLAYPSSVISPRTVLLSSPYGWCRFTVSLRGRILSSCKGT